MTTSWQPDLFQSDAFQIAGGVAATSTEVTIAVVERGDNASLTLRFPDAGAGRSRRRRRERYVAQYRGELFEFETLEELEAFVAQARIDEAPKPKKQREPVKITLSPEFTEEIAEYVDIPPRLGNMPVTSALAQVRKIDYTVERILADAQRRADEEDEEIMMMVLL